MGSEDDSQSVDQEDSLTVSATLLNGRVETVGRTAANIAITASATARGGSTTCLHSRDEDIDETADVKILS
jgi:hypothetical protein